MFSGQMKTREPARSALEGGSGAAALARVLQDDRTAGAGAPALQGACGAASACVVLMAAIVFATTVVFAASKPTLKSIGEALICQCGCGQTVYGCNHFECASRAEMNALIEKEIAAGKDETTILQDFVKQYGVQVLASPPAKGFTLMAWVLPGLGLVVGLAVVITFVRRWRKPPAKPGQSPPAPIDPKLLEAVEEEMKKVAG